MAVVRALEFRSQRNAAAYDYWCGLHDGDLLPAVVDDYEEEEWTGEELWNEEKYVDALEEYNGYSDLV